MKSRKLISMLLALVMMMALVVPAGAAKPAKNKGNTPAAQAISVDKIEGDDPRKPIVESGAEIDTAGYPAIYIKQGNDIAIIVPAGEKRTDAVIIAEAAASDNSLNKQDKGTTTVIRGNGSVWLHKNKTTQVTVKNGILTVVGPISHIDFGGGKPAPEFPTDTDDGTTSTTVTFIKYVDGFDNIATENFEFEVYNSENKKVDVEITGTNGEYSFKVEPKLDAGEYTIKEVLTDEQANRFVGGKALTFTVNEAGEATFEDDDNGFINETKTVVEFTKTVDGETPTEDFVFEVYDSNDRKLDNVTITGNSGVYGFEVSPKLDAGEYTIKEVLGDKANRFVDGKTLSFIVDNKGVASFTDNTFANETKTVVEFTKTVDSETPTEDFRFDIYQGETPVKENVFTVSDDHGTYTATITPKLADGEYTIVEVLTDEQKGQYVDGKTLTFSVENGVAAFTTSTIDNEQLGFIKVTNPTVKQKHITQYHETEYVKYDDGTVVSVYSDFEKDGYIVKDYGTQASGKGFSYLKINKAELIEEGSLTVKIGYKDGWADENHTLTTITPCPDMKDTGNTPTYTITVDGNKLIPTSDLGAFTVKAGNTTSAIAFNPSTHYNNETIDPIDLTALGEEFYIFFHGATDKVPYETTEIKGCIFDRNEESLVDVSTQCTFTVTVKDSEGNAVADYADGVLPGTYTVEVTATFNEETLTWKNDSVVVTPGDTTSVTFEAETVNAVVKEIMCSCDKDLTPVEP